MGNKSNIRYDQSANGTSECPYLYKQIHQWVKRQSVEQNFKSRGSGHYSPLVNFAQWLPSEGSLDGKKEKLMKIHE